MPKTRAELEEVRAQVGSGDLDVTYLGASDEAQDGVWRWLDSELLAYDAWRAGEVGAGNMGAARGCVVALPS